MAFFSVGLTASSEHGIVAAFVHLSNAKFMAAMWVVVGVIFVTSATRLHDDSTWRVIRIASMGISIAGAVRLLEMLRLGELAGYGTAAAIVELLVPPTLIFLRNRDARRRGVLGELS